MAVRTTRTGVDRRDAYTGIAASAAIVARMERSEIRGFSGADRCPGFRFAHPGYGIPPERLNAPQGREQREGEQRDRADHEAEREDPEAMAAWLLEHDRLRRRRHQRVLALDHAAGDIIGDGVEDRGDVVGFGDHDAAEPGILDKTVDALVASHHDMRNHVDPKPRRVALADAAIEQIDLFRNLREQRVERLVQNFEPGHLGVTQVDDDAGAIGGLCPEGLRLPLTYQ